MTLESFEVLFGDVRRRHWTRATKEEIVCETLAEGTTVTEVARRRGIDRSLIYRWPREFKVSREQPSDRFLPVHVNEMPVPGAADAQPGAESGRVASPAAFNGRTGRMEVALGRGRRITVFAEALARVIGVLEGR